MVEEAKALWLEAALDANRAIPEPAPRVSEMVTQP
jgi:predicted RNase H-like HicB family nuclease